MLLMKAVQQGIYLKDFQLMQLARLVLRKMHMAEIMAGLQPMHHMISTNVVVALVEQGGFGAGSAGPIVRDVLAAYFNVPVNKKSNDTNSKK